MVFGFMPNIGGDLDGVSMVSIYLTTPSVWLAKALGLASSGGFSDIIYTVLVVTVTFFEMFIPIWFLIWLIYGRRRA